jgi:hypothetical protein
MDLVKLGVTEKLAPVTNMFRDLRAIFHHHVVTDSHLPCSPPSDHVSAAQLAVDLSVDMPPGPKDGAFRIRY